MGYVRSFFAVGGWQRFDTPSHLPESGVKEGTMLRHAISHSRLMRESTDRVQSALASADNNEQLVARRILENPAVWSQWENEHSMLMRQLANCGVRKVQIVALKHATFRLLHGKALFQYLRRSEVRGRERTQVM